ncbi:hypothetical protein UFOVP1439_33 [uncultured Caudovirales phage]|uniref:Uncharacterized protein n=1 Tax=uncultured Caudovirales phage TaxID=2100421 RepID=A0A6J5SFC9_9CAUD|nr:hypothetical protein UFOVP1085_13 [uncultured Caudovirales phage]CAB4212687.1 hypothetical protein UFOVP1439_33 [uncultured Caudovirales phage]
MDTDKIIEQIERFQTGLLRPGQNGVEINDPGSLAEAIVKIRVLLVQLVDKVADAELEFKRTRAARYDKLITEGTKRSPATDILKFDQELIEMESNAERIRNYMRYVDSLVSAVQSLLKVASSAERNQY